MPDDKEYLYEVSLILDHAETDQHRYGIDETRFIKIEINTAKDIAANLGRIASKMPTVIH